MAQIIFKYCLPSLLAYILFVGISGQIWPFKKPTELAERPSWLLGLWTAIAVGLTLTIGLHMAYQMNLAEAQQLIRPSAWLLAAVLLPGLVAYLIYSKAVHQELDMMHARENNKALPSPSVDNVELINFDDLESSDTQLDQAFDHAADFSDVNDVDVELPVTTDSFADELSMQMDDSDAAILDSEKSTVLDRLIAEPGLSQEIEPMQWSESHTMNGDEALVTGIEHMYWNDTTRSAAMSTDNVEPLPTEDLVTGIEHMYWPQPTDVSAGGEPAKELEQETEEVTASAINDAAVEIDTAAEIAHDDKTEVEIDHEATLEAQADIEPEVESLLTVVKIDADKPAVESIELAAEIEVLRRTLESEVALREETEKHLRITRKGLSALESENSLFELEKADAVIDLEEKLESQIKRTATSEAHAARTESQKAALEGKMLDLKNSVVDAKREIRQSTAARAKALSTANKSVTFAQQAIKARTSLEAQLRDAEQALKNRQETISSLISALEKEKQRTQDEVASMAKQFVLHEKQLQARRSIEQASRQAEGKLGSRLVKKVASAANKSAA